MNDRLAFLSLEQVSAMIKRRDLSPLELIDAQLRRIEMLDPTINAFITVTAAQARQEAAQAEKQLARGHRRGRLHGIPIAYKDNIETKGLRTTAHSRLFATHVPTADAAVVLRMKEAGAVSLGKLAMHELAYGSPAAGDLFPAARNPWNTACSPGGSSSGCGAAVAGGFVFAALGTDTGGSVRHPAAVCGLVGIKPTFGAVCNAGVIPLSPSQDHVGVLTRTVRDSAIVLDALTSHPRRSLLDGIDDGVAGLRIGVPRRFIERIGLHPDVAEAFSDAVAAVAGLGAAIVDIDIAGLDEANTLGTRILIDEAYRQYGAALHARPAQFQQPFRDRVLAGDRLTQAERTEAALFRERLTTAYAAMFDSGIDVVLTPGREEPAIELAAQMQDPLSARGRCTRMYNLVGLPAMVVPMGCSATGLPLSLQFAGPAFSEALLYRLARAYEAAMDWAMPFPMDVPLPASGSPGSARLDR